MKTLLCYFSGNGFMLLYNNQHQLYQPFLLRVRVPEINNNEKESTPFSRFYSQCISIKSERLNKLFGVEPVN